MQSVTGRRTTLPILSHILWNVKRIPSTHRDRFGNGNKRELNASVHQNGKASVSAKKYMRLSVNFR